MTATTAPHDMIGGNCCAFPEAAPWEQAEAAAEMVERHLLACPTRLLLPLVLISRALRRSGHRLSVTTPTPDEPRYLDVVCVLVSSGAHLTLGEIQAMVGSGNSEALLAHLARAVKRGMAMQCHVEAIMFRPERAWTRSGRFHDVTATWMGAP